MAHDPIAPIRPEAHAARRRRFVEEIGDGIALIPGGRLKRRSGDVDHVFRQESDLLYLSGFDQPEAAAVLSRDRYVLFVQPRDPAAETWTGIRPGVEGAREHYGADEAYPIAELPRRLPDLIADRTRLYYPLGVDRRCDQTVIEALGEVHARGRRGVAAPRDVSDPRALIHEMRLRKEEEELDILRAAAAISCEAHREAARLCHAGRREYEIEAALHAVFRSRGGSGPAYPSIVGSGENGTILHYVENRGRLADGEVVLIDAGVELHGYASDVTRSYPVGGRFEGLPQAVYEIVLAAQEAAVAEVRPGVTLAQIHDVALRTLVDGLIELGALDGSPDDVIEREAYRPFYMHTTSHWLGLDVHDVGDYRIEGKPRPLEPGMVFTVEPGLYFAARTPETPEQLRGIGIRIEDDVAVTDDGVEVLTRAIPKRPAEVEEWVA